MWIPYFLFEFWEPDTSMKTVRASEADNDEREFEMWFCLENPPTRRRDVELRLAAALERQRQDSGGRTGRGWDSRSETRARGRHFGTVTTACAHCSATGLSSLDPGSPFTLSSLLMPNTACGGKFSLSARLLRTSKYQARWRCQTTTRLCSLYTGRQGTRRAPSIDSCAATRSLRCGIEEVGFSARQTSWCKNDISLSAGREGVLPKTCWSHLWCSVLIRSSRASPPQHFSIFWVHGARELLMRSRMPATSPTSTSTRRRSNSVRSQTLLTWWRGKSCSMSSGFGLRYGRLSQI